MKNNRFLYLSFLLCILISCNKEKINVHILGDSTMEQQDPNIKDQRGWPQFIQGFFTDNIKVLNHAKSGTSTKTFYNAGYWERAKSTIRPGDYVLIQFAHNDEKHGGMDGETGTAPTDSFKIYLSRYVNEVREIGANPVLFTPIVRKMFGRDGKLSRRGKHDLGEHYRSHIDNSLNASDTVTYNYVYNMKVVSDSLDCPLIDMTHLSAELVNSLGNELATKLIYNLPKDGTHFGAGGSLLLSQLAAKALKEQHILAKYIKEDVELLVSPQTIDLGKIYPNTALTRIFNIGCLYPENSNGNLIVTSTGDIEISTDEKDGFSTNLSLPYDIKNKCEVFKLYARTTPETIGKLSGTIKVTDSKTEQIITLQGECIPIEESSSISVVYQLYNHEKPSAEGPVIALAEEWSDMVFDGYYRPREINVSDPDGTYYNTKVQCNKIIGGAWPGNEIDVVYSRYVQFGLQAIKNSSLNITNIQLAVGGGTHYRIVYAINKNFVEAVTLTDYTGESNEMRQYDFQLMKEINENDTFELRIYPWCEKKNQEAQLCLYDIRINGVQINKE